MAVLKSFVHRVKSGTDGRTYAYLGPDRSEVEVFNIAPSASSPRQLAALAGMTDMLNAALIARREVTIIYEGTSITHVIVELP